MAASTAERAPVRRARAKSDPPHLAEPAITFSFKT
ncbi:phosphatase and actin regulator 1 isoform X2, partial [Tachysurus ichikawai]